MANGSGPGAYRIFNTATELEKAYPQLKGWAPELSMSIELTNFDIASCELKPEHKDGIYRGSLGTSDREYKVAWSFGFHSHTGGQAFNSQLAEARADSAIRFAYSMRGPDTVVGEWKHTSVSWRPGFPDGESAEMRKVLIVYFKGLPIRPPIAMGPTKNKR
ncbi:hypothetical protein [Sphingomonas immobilis]|uniref:Uncharacterized protein n=1 Tax=Sphingomonas immobilis TaxID=3063997 RepID=A0ABT8ZYK8_9SPHN|nr:hypothetical protein [Sphingomonas sp. CA1-15]MDO7841851.1 hypothetical protein [Sphingomonas sp. CA1-15]